MLSHALVKKNWKMNTKQISLPKSTILTRGCPPYTYHNTPEPKHYSNTLLYISSIIPPDDEPKTNVRNNINFIKRDEPTITVTSTRSIRNFIFPP